MRERLLRKQGAILVLALVLAATALAGAAFSGGTWPFLVGFAALALMLLLLLVRGEIPRLPDGGGGP